MVLSRWPYPPGRERATLSRCLISSGVRYSRGRTAALVVRRGVIVRFSMVGPPFAFTRKPLDTVGEVGRAGARGYTAAGPPRSPAMSLKPTPIEPVPEGTARVARAAY